MSEAIRTEIFASAAVSAAGNTAGFSLPTASNLFIGIDVTAWVTAGPIFTLQASDDGGTTWFDYASDVAVNLSTAAALNLQLAITGVGKYSLIAKNFAADRYRVRWTLASGSATFSISVVAK
jgi:hypothetical protein